MDGAAHKRVFEKIGWVTLVGHWYLFPCLGISSSISLAFRYTVS